MCRLVQKTSCDLPQGPLFLIGEYSSGITGEGKGSILQGCSYNEPISKSPGKAGKSKKSQIGLSDSQLQSVLFYTDPLQSNVHCVGKKKSIEFDIVLVNGVPFHLSITFF